MISSCSFLYTLVLVSLSGHMVAAMPAPQAEDEGLGRMLADEPAAVPPIYGRLDAQDGRPGDGRSKIIVVSDLRLKRFQGLNPAFFRSPHLLADRNDVPDGDDGLTLGRRNADLDILRCMVGRVYRPCWEVEI